MIMLKGNGESFFFNLRRLKIKFFAIWKIWSWGGVFVCEVGCLGFCYCSFFGFDDGGYEGCDLERIFGFSWNFLIEVLRIECSKLGVFLFTFLVVIWLGFIRDIVSING